jgi:hypothetical protein
VTRLDGTHDVADDGEIRRRKKDRQLPGYLRAWAFSAIATACIVFAFSDGLLHLPSSRADAPRDYLLRGLFLLAALALGWVLYHVDWKGQIANAANPPDQAYQPDEKWLADLQTHIKPDMQRLDTRGVLTFIDLLANPASYRVRVAESVDFVERGLRQRVGVEFNIPASALDAKYLYLPVLMPIKGELLDNFRLYDASGKSVANLSYEETTRLAAVGLTYLLSGSESANGDEADRAEAVAVDQIVLLGPVARRGRIDISEAQQEVDERINALRTTVSDSTRERLRAYLKLLSVTYPIVIVISPEAMIAGRLLITYELTLIPRAERKGWEGRFRLALGLRPYQLAMPVNLAFTAQSYHLRISGPGDKYVMRQYLCCRHCGKLVRRNWRSQDAGAKSETPSQNCRHTVLSGNQTTGKRHFRLRQRRGQSYVHLYMRGYASDDAPRDLQFLARFREVPPGSLANAAATALITTLLIAVAGYLSTHVRGSAYSDIPALILALPVAAASWMGINEDAGKLVGSSLLARLSLIVSGLLSIAAIVIYLALTPKDPAKDHTGSHSRSNVHPFEILGIHHTGWNTLVILSLLNFAYVAFRFAVRVTYYNYLRSKPGHMEAEYGD